MKREPVEDSLRDKLDADARDRPRALFGFHRALA
jgi:hypothetical protein